MNPNRRLTRVAFKTPEKVLKNLSVVATVGAVVSLAGVIIVPERAWPNILLANYYLMSLGLAGVVFIALQYVSNAGWATAIRRVPEAMTSVLPLSAIVMLTILLGTHTLYEWSHESVVASDQLLQKKAGWLNVPFFVVRTVVYLAIWLVMSSMIVKRSRRQDGDGNVRHTLANRKWSAAFIVIFGLTFSLATFDWIMSLQPHWFSTIFAIYNMCGMFLNGIATMTLIVILLRRWGPLAKVVTDSHLHDLGKLIFAFSTFWMYIWFSQYILIWYANIPEEVRFYTVREEGGWRILTIVNVLFNWVIPFLTLLPIWTKKHEGTLLRVCIMIMLAHWIDLFWMILPPFMKGNPAVIIWEMAPMAALVAGFFLLTFKALSTHNLVAIGDPYLVESLGQHH